VVNLVRLGDAATKPAGDFIVCDVAREDASVVLADLRALGVDRDGSIAMEYVDASIGRASEAAERAAEGSPVDAVVWGGRHRDDLGVRGSLGGSSSPSWSSPRCWRGRDLPATPRSSPSARWSSAPSSGRVAGVCVALVERRPRLAAVSGRALAVGFPLGIAAAR
jgi:hypothetical protein